MNLLKRLFALPERKLLPHREAAIAELRSIHISSPDPHLSLDGAAVEVLDQSESVQHDDGRIEAFFLTQIVRAEAGEYFLLKTTGKRPYAKHLPQRSAEHLLGSRYRPPDA